MAKMMQEIVAQARSLADIRKKLSGVSNEVLAHMAALALTDDTGPIAHWKGELYGYLGYLYKLKSKNGNKAVSNDLIYSVICEYLEDFDHIINKAYAHLKTPKITKCEAIERQSELKRLIESVLQKVIAIGNSNDYLFRKEGFNASLGDLLYFNEDI